MERREWHFGARSYMKKYGEFRCLRSQRNTVAIRKTNPDCKFGSLTQERRWLRQPNNNKALYQFDEKTSTGGIV